MSRFTALLPALLFLAPVLHAPVLHAAITINLNPTADAFTSANNPTSNYGAAGALNVSGSAAVNGGGVAQGLFDSFMMFNTSSAVSSFNSTYGLGNWTITGASLLLTEQATPAQTLFNRGTGTFGITAIAATSFPEGTGTPTAPTTNGINYSGGNYPESAYLSANDVSLGTSFSNSGVNNQQESFVLPLTSATFTNELDAGGPAGFYLTATSSSIGFTFNSNNFTTQSSRPILSLTASAAPEPSRSLLVFAVGLGLLLQRRRPTRMEA